MTENIKFGLRPDEVAEAFGSMVLYREVVEAGWLQPVIRRHKLTIYDRGAVAKCWARILAGELPSKSPKTTN